MRERPQPREMPDMTPRERRRNWWLYHRRQVLLGAAVLVLLGGILRTQLSQIRPDCSAALVVRHAASSEDVAALETALSSLIPDLNGDGTRAAAVNAIELDYTAGDLDGAALTRARSSVEKLQADFFAGQSGVFVLDDPEHFQESHQALRYLDGTAPGEGAVDWENMVRPWRESRAAALADFDSLDPDSLWVGRRLPGDREPEGTNELWNALFPED